MDNQLPRLLIATVTRSKLFQAEVMKTIITIGIAIICTFFGIAAAVSFSHDVTSLVALFAGSLFGGLYVGNVIAARLAYKPKRRSPSQESHPNHSPRSFPERLGDFQGLTTLNRGGAAQDVGASEMPFWMLEIAHEPTPPKPTSFIRRILFSIRHILGQHDG